MASAYSESPSCVYTKHLESPQFGRDPVLSSERTSLAQVWWLRWRQQFHLSCLLWVERETNLVMMKMMKITGRNKGLDRYSQDHMTYLWVCAEDEGLTRVRAQRSAGRLVTAWRDFFLGRRGICCRKSAWHRSRSQKAFLWMPGGNSLASSLFELFTVELALEFLDNFTRFGLRNVEIHHAHYFWLHLRQ